VHRVDPQLDLVGARRVPVIPKRNPQIDHGLGPKFAGQIERIEE
jgi:hypothetical protein